MAVGIEHSYVFFQAVALLTECVDRNPNDLIVSLATTVALLTECVDRNTVTPAYERILEGRTPYGVRG